MHIHNVYFWLTEADDQMASDAFAQGLEQLVKDPNILHAYFGPPAATKRDVVDSSYSYGLVLVFADLAAHDRYQVGTGHEQFLDHHAHQWHKVTVFDITM